MPPSAANANGAPQVAENCGPGVVALLLVALVGFTAVQGGWPLGGPVAVARVASTSSGAWEEPAGPSDSFQGAAMSVTQEDHSLQIQIQWLLSSFPLKGSVF